MFCSFLVFFQGVTSSTQEELGAKNIKVKKLFQNIGCKKWVLINSIRQEIGNDFSKPLFICMNVNFVPCTRFVQKITDYFKLCGKGAS